MISRRTLVRKDEPEALEAIKTILNKIESNPKLIESDFDDNNFDIVIEFDSQEDSEFFDAERKKILLHCNFDGK